MVATLRIRVTGLKEAEKGLLNIERLLPKAGKKAVEEIGKKTAKQARKNLSRHTEMTSRLKSLIHSTRAKRAGRKGWKVDVVADSEAAFWEEGVRKHWVSFFNPKKGSAIGTPRSKFRKWARNLGMDELQMRVLGALEVEIPKTQFMAKAHISMGKRVGGIVTKHITKI